MHYPSPDILAGNKIRRLAVEVKITKEEKKYFPYEEIKQLQNFSAYFGAEPWLAIKFSKHPWVFVSPEDLGMASENFCFGTKDIEKKGLFFDDVIGRSEL